MDDCKYSYKAYCENQSGGSKNELLNIVNQLKENNSVTLGGTKSEHENIMSRLDKLEEQEEASKQEMSPSEMIEAFMGGREYYNDIKNLVRATATFNFDEGAIYTCTWFDWEGTSKSTGVVVGNPVHAWFKWDGDKVSEVTYIFDSAQYVENMSQME